MFGHLWGTSVTSVNALSETSLSGLGNMVRSVAKRAGAIVLVAGLAACSTAPDWARPSLIYGDDAAATATKPTAEKDFPELADVPDKPAPSSTAEERRQAAEGLAADRAQARYTDEVLRGGTEAPAQAPRSAAPVPAPTPAIGSVPASPVPNRTVTETAPDKGAGIIPAPGRGGHALPSATVARTADVPQNRGAETQAVEIVTTNPTSRPAPVAQAPVAQAPVVQAPVRATPATQASNPVSSVVATTAPAQASRRAAVPPLSESERAARAQRASATSRAMIDDRLAPVDASAAAVQAVATPRPSTATSTGPSTATAPSVTPSPTARATDRFEASTAPVLAQEALDAAGPVVRSRYGAPATTTIGSADPEDPVTVNLDALRGIPGPGASLQPREGPEVTAAFADQGGPGNIPPYVVSFGHGSVQLAAADRVKLAQAAEVAMNTGGIVRVVGHASSRTGDLGVAKHVLANFKASLDRATAVADELIRNGVDPSHVFVEAKGDSVPVYYESMPAGEAGNRRAEVFIE